MSAILFYDPLCPRPYDTRTLLNEAMGGTEATLTRVADALGAYVVQHNRTEVYGRYLPPERNPDIKQVVINRDSRALAGVRELYPNARLFLWLHDQLRPGSKRGRRLAATAPLLREMAVTVVCVSDSQRRNVEAALHHIGVDDRVRALTIYNPIDAALQPEASVVEPNKLVFFSSPNKGLKFTLDAFRAVRRALPDMRLLVGNPGYKVKGMSAIAGVEDLGPLPQASMHAVVRTALCTFFPNFRIPETFGLVFAESHALGTPVLTVDCGSAAEVVNDPAQVLPLRAAYRRYEFCVQSLPSGWRAGPARVAASLGLFDPFVETLRAWRNGSRPRVQADPRFRLTTVAEQWRKLLAQ